MVTTIPLDYAHAHRDRFLDDLKAVLQIPSISTLPEHRDDMVQAAEWLRNRLDGIGVPSELIPGDGHPLVYGEWVGAPGAPTVLVYGHYDVQPVDPVELWESPPFDPTVRDGSIYARGASDDKGQTMTFLNAAESFLQTGGALPLNVKFLLEGQEECGSEVIEGYVRHHPDRLRADIVQIADSGMVARGIPTIETGLRGMVYAEILTQGPATDLHSGLYGGVAPNPLNALAQIIAGLSNGTGTITIPAFYDDVRMPDEDVLRSWRSLPFDEEQLRLEEIGSPALVGEEAYSPIERIWARPTLDVHGITGGFTGAGAKTVIPARAAAKISMRLVPDQDPNRIFELFRKQVLTLTPPGIKVDVRLIHSGLPVTTQESSPYVAVAREALEQTFGHAPVLARSGGSIPIVGVFKQVLDIDSLLIGWGLPDDNLHAPNEKFSLDNYFLGTDAIIRLWAALGGIERPPGGPRSSGV